VNLRSVGRKRFARLSDEKTEIQVRIKSFEVDISNCLNNSFRLGTIIHTVHVGNVADPAVLWIWICMDLLWSFVFWIRLRIRIGNADP
jgi:hypothetical protein